MEKRSKVLVSSTSPMKAIEIDLPTQARTLVRMVAILARKPEIADIVLEFMKVLDREPVVRVTTRVAKRSRHYSVTPDKRRRNRYVRKLWKQGFTIVQIMEETKHARPTIMRILGK